MYIHHVHTVADHINESHLLLHVQIYQEWAELAWGKEERVRSSKPGIKSQ